MRRNGGWVRPQATSRDEPAACTRSSAAARNLRAERYRCSARIRLPPRIEQLETAWESRLIIEQAEERPRRPGLGYPHRPRSADTRVARTHHLADIHQWSLALSTASR